MLLGVLGTQELMIIFALVLLVILVIRIAKKSALKKFFGILFLVVGLIMVGLGSAALTELSSRNNSFEGRIRDSFNSQYHSENEDQKTIGIVLIAGGSVFFIIGVMMLASKTNLQRKKETELEVLKAMQASTFNVEQKTENREVHKPKLSINETYAYLEKLGKLKKQGLLTEEEFQVQKNKILA